MRKKTKHLFWLITLLFPMTILAQVPVSGVVVDARNNPVSGVSVRLTNSNSGTATDATGRCLAGTKLG